MMSSKRSSFSSSKSGSKFNGKLKETLSSSSRPKAAEAKVPDHKDFSNVTLIKQIDNAMVLPKYTSILSKNGEQAVSMSDLDLLQQDLKRLLSTNTIRTRFFLGEYLQADQKDGQFITGKKTHDKTSLKRKRPDEKSKCRDNGLRVVRTDQLKSYNDSSYKDTPKIMLPRNNISDRFWASIEPYCVQVNKDDVAFLDTLMQEFGKKIDLKIPEIGDHYANSWSEELLKNEKNLGKSPSKKPADVKKNVLHKMFESFGTPHTQRLLSALIQNRALKATIPTTGNVNKLKSSELSKVKHKIGKKVGTCLDKRLLKELVEQGILSNDDMQKGVPDDEILAEIKKCRQELVTVNKYNVEETNKLRSAVMNDIQCNQLKDDLVKIDQEVLDLYTNIVLARVQDGGKEYKKLFSEQMISDLESKVNALLRQQHVLNREINGMTDMSMLY